MIIISAGRITELGATVNYPFVAYDNQAARPSSTLSSPQAVLTDGALANAVSGTTYDYWLPNITATSASYTVTLNSSRTLSFAGVAGHNISTLGGTVKIQRSTDGGATWSDAGAGDHTPTDNSPIAFRMINGVTNAADKWRVNITGLTAGDPLYVAVIFIGDDITFPLGLNGGFAPPIYPNEVGLQSNVSVGGNLLGSSVIAQGTKLSAQMTYMTPDFVRSTLSGFIPAFNQGTPFFFGWRPTTFNTDLRYCWRDGETIMPSNSGGRDFMAFNMSMRAYED
jgi:hypothetical protein